MNLLRNPSKDRLPDALVGRQLTDTCACVTSFCWGGDGVGRPQSQHVQDLLWKRFFPSEIPDIGLKQMTETNTVRSFFGFFGMVSRCFEDPRALEIGNSGRILGQDHYSVTK